MKDCNLEIAMLRSLAVKNFTIIQKAQLEFSAGMTTITGETGAGKSILIGALGLALGCRAQSQQLSGDGKLAVTLEVELDKLPQISAWLEEQEFSGGGECILRRTLTQDGRSRAFINGVQVPLIQLQRLSDQLIEIVGQNAQQSLLQAGKHLEILDAQCEHNDTLSKMRKTQQQWNTLRQRLKARMEQSRELEGRIELLNYQTKELEEFAPEDGEFEEIDQAYRSLSKKDLLREQAHKALTLLDESDTGDAVSQITAATQALRELTDTGLVTASAQLDTALEHIQIASREIKDSLKHIEISEEDYQRLEQRLQGYLDLARKYKTKPETLAGFCRHLRKELDKIESPDASPEEMERQLGDLKMQYATLADKISQQRKTTAATLSKQVTQTLGELNMQGAEFSVVFKPHADDTPQPHGQEQAEFFVRTNAGQPPYALTRIASGGELSRVSLAIQAAFAAKNPIPTLVFDEVDAGVGGKTAEMVGKLLKKISRSTQVFCITHLPQVAAQADHHFRVDKQEKSGNVEINVTELSAATRRHEIARMMAGVEITEKSLAHAGEMLSGK